MGECSRGETIGAKVRIGDRRVGPGRPAYVIAEIGSNHDGRLDRARSMVALAALCGADAVKFQSFTADGLVARRVPGASGALEPNPTHPVIEGLSLPAQWHGELQAAARSAGLDFLSAPFDPGRLRLLDRLGVPAIKIASGDLTYDPLLRAAAGTGRPILLSTGMADVREVSHAVETLAASGNEQVVLLHCVSRYPTPLGEANVGAVRSLRERFGLPVGVSDHSPGLAAALAAVALGACVVEKHLTFDRSLPGPDHGFAMEPGEFERMVREIRRVEQALGTGRIEPGEEERRERRVGRRSVVAARELRAGTVLAPTDVRCVRPGDGIPPTELPRLLGRKLARPVEVDQPLSWEDLIVSEGG